MDFANMRAKRVCIVTDQNVLKLDAMKQAVEGLTREGIEFTIFDKVRVEPKDSSLVTQSHISNHLLTSTVSRKPSHLPNPTILTLFSP